MNAPKDHQQHQPVRLDGFIDATQLLHQACKELESGQMVHSQGFTLMDAMGAIQVMDPRMDSGMDPPSHQDVDLLRDCSTADAEDQETNRRQEPLPETETQRSTAFKATFDLGNSPGSALTEEEVCWIMDQVVTREVAFHQGASLAQTLYTCLYVHQLQSSSNLELLSSSERSNTNNKDNLLSTILLSSNPSDNASPALGEEISPSTRKFSEDQIPTPTSNSATTSTSRKSPPQELTTLVLFVYMKAVLACHALVWEELCSGNLVDGEDFAGDTAGLPLLESYLENQCTAPEIARENISEAVGLLEKAREWIKESREKDAIPKAMAEALDDRLQFRTNLLFIAILSKPSLRLFQELIPRCQSVQQTPVRSYPSLDLSSSASSSSTSYTSSSSSIPASQRLSFRNGISIFDPSLARRLPSPTPPREADLPTQEQVKAFWMKAMKDLQCFAEAGETAGEIGDVESWRMYFMTSASRFQTDPSCAWIRSLWQTFVYSPATGVTAGHLPLEHLATSFFEFSAGVEKSFLRRIALTQSSNDSEDGDNQMASRAISGFISRATGQMVNYLCIYSQNRSRQKRSLAKAYGSLVELTRQGAELGQMLEQLRMTLPFHPDSIFASIQSLTLELMIQIIFSGFELELYRRDEWNSIYFVGMKILDEALEVLDGLIEERKAQRKVDENKRKKGLSWLESQVEFLGALKQTSLGIYQMMRAASTFPNPSCPFKSSTRSSSLFEAMDATFNSQSLAKSTFELRFKWMSIQGKPETKSHAEGLWETFQQDYSKKVEVQEFLKDSVKRFEGAVSLIGKYNSRNTQECKIELCETDFKELLRLLVHTCQNNREACVKLLENRNQSLDWTFQDSHPWFPTAIVEA